MGRKKKAKTNPGPVPDHLKLEGDWRDVMGKAIKKKRPKDGWPNSEKEEKANN